MCGGVGEQGQAADRTAPTTRRRDGQRDAQHGGEFAAVVGQLPVAVAVVAHDAALTLLQWASVQHVALEEEAMVGPHPQVSPRHAWSPSRVATPAMTSPAIRSATTTRRGC